MRSLRDSRVRRACLTGAQKRSLWAIHGCAGGNAQGRWHNRGLRIHYSKNRHQRPGKWVAEGASPVADALQRPKLDAERPVAEGMVTDAWVLTSPVAE